MRKSIYYLLANVLSTVAALIFVACISSHAYPFFDGSLVVTGLSADAFEAFKYILIVAALSIIYCAYDVSASKDNKVVKGEKLGNILGAIVTVLSVLYTWIAVILVFDNYKIGATISVPYYVIGSIIGGVAMMYLGAAVSKKNQGITASLIATSFLFMISGVLMECLPYWYTALSAYGASALILIVLVIISLSAKKKAR